jgi:hypothetical protein
MRRKAMRVTAAAVLVGTLIAWGPSALADKKSPADKKAPAAGAYSRVVSGTR